MSRKIRFLIMWIFILFFLIITPLVLLYTNGWRYNWQKAKAERKAVLIVDIQPQNNNFYINNHLIQKLFPFSTIHLDNLKSGDYNIKIEKENYFPWSKVLTINTNETTFINKVVLFKKSNAQKINKTEINNSLNFPKKNIVLYEIKNKNFLEYYIFNLKTEESKLLYRKSNDIEKDYFIKDNFEWSKNNDFLLYKENQNIIIFNLNEDQKILDLKNILNKEKIKTAHWDKKYNNLVYLLTENNTIYQLNINEAKNYYNKFPKFKNEIDDFLINNDNLFYLNKNTNESLFFIYSEKENRSKLLLSLKENNYKLKELNSNDWLIYNDKDSYLFQNKDKKLYFKYFNTNNLFYSYNNNKIAYVSNLNELWTWEDFQNPNKTAKSYLLARFSSQIDAVNWYINNEYLIYLLNNTINIIELDGRGNFRNSYKIYESPFKIYNFILDKNGKNIYIFQKDGIYKLKIQ